MPNAALKSSCVKTAPAFKRLKRTLSKLPGLERAYLFGPGEDLNLLIIGEVDHPSLLQMVREAENTLDRGINFLKCSTSEFARRLDSGDPFMSNIITSSPQAQQQGIRIETMSALFAAGVVTTKKTDVNRYSSINNHTFPYTLTSNY